MHILHVIGTPGLGGVQVYLLDLSKYDKQYGISRNLLFLHGNEGELKSKFLDNGVNYYACNIMYKDYGLRPYRLWKGIRKEGVLAGLICGALFTIFPIFPEVVTPRLSAVVIVELAVIIVSKLKSSR